MGWQVGDHCQAVYTEDGEIYEAKILSIDSDNQTCVVRYLGYGNEEQQSLEDLMPSSHHSNKPFSYSEVGLYCADIKNSVQHQCLQFQ